MTMRNLKPTAPVLNQTVSAGPAVRSTSFALGYMFSAQASYVVSVGAGLTATFQLMVSMDGTTYLDSGEVLPSVSGSAASFPVQYSGAFPFVLIQVSPSGGSGAVTITGCAKGGC